MPYTLKVSKSPTDALSCTNCLIVGPDVQNKAFLKGTKCSFRYNKDKDKDEEIHYVRLSANPGHKCLFAVLTKQMKAGEVGLSLIQREWTQVTLQSEAILEPVMETIYAIESVTIKCDFFQKKVKTGEPFQHDKLVDDFKKTFANQPLTKDQKLVFKHENKPLLMMVVCDLRLIEKKPGLYGVVNLQTTRISFEKKEGSDAIIRGAKHIPTSENSIFNPDWNFGNMGIGGLDKEFTAIFRRAFASRVYPPEIVEDLDMKHVKGILLYGPPGTGKTLMARQIGKMLNATQPKIVNGPEILNKFVGESEKNIRDLFAEAEKDQKEMGPNSPLHMIIFDEIDAICKQRGTVTGSTGVADTVVNQLLSKIDGVEQLNNILVIGMTNRKDLIDEALLRPGRLEVQMEINLPNEEGRLQILNIHTSALRTNRRLAPDVNLSEISKEIKNYSGAEIEGLVRAATSTAFNKMITQENGKVSVDSKAINNIMVTNGDFRYAIENDIKPAFGHGSEDAEHFLANGVIDYGEPFQHILKTSEILINQTRNGKLVSPVTVLLEGPPGCGKTSVAAHVAFNMAEFPFIKVVSPENMIGFSESARCQAIKKIFDDAYKSELSCIVVDDIERLIEYTAIGPRFSNVILQTLIVLLKKKVPKKHKLLVIGTTSSKKLLQDMDVTNCFNSSINIPPIRDVIHMTNVVCALGMFQDAEVTAIEDRLKVQSLQLKIDLTKLMSFVEMAIQAEDSVTAFVDFVKTHCGVIY